MTIHKIITGDCRQMDLLDDQSVELVVTSPPYWQLKDYGTTGQIGYRETYENYINSLNLVWNECFRVLKNGCRLCVNIGDQFARAATYGRYKVIPIRTEIIKFCESIGFDYMGAVIWQKKTTTNTTGGASLMGSYPFPRNGVISIDYEFILLFKKLGKSERPLKEIKESSAMTKEEWKEYFNGHWNFGGARQDGHIAVFPEELPKRLIKMFSFVGDTVLDPFAGSGTTSSVAKKLNRNSVGYEINDLFIPIIKRKLETEKTEENQFEFYEQTLTVDFEEELSKLPYLFRDFQNFDKKNDPKSKSYGSVIDKNSKAREEYFTVQEVLSSELVRLNTGKIVKLLGVREKTESAEEARTFLKLKTAKQRVYLRLDENVNESEEYLPAYLYLKNRTFLNAHMIKNDLVDVDKSLVFKHKQKFLKLIKSKATD